MTLEEEFNRFSSVVSGLPTHIFESIDGWINLAQITGVLKTNGIDFHEGGYVRLVDYINHFGERLQVQKFTPRGKSAIVTYVKLGTSGKKTQNDVTLSETTEVHTPQKPELFQWADCGKFQEMLKQLATLALPEKWNFKNEENGTFPILQNYLFYTFVRLKTEKKITISPRGDFAVFNTGLVNELYAPVYALFSKKPVGKESEWLFKSFAVEGQEWAGKTLVSEFPKLPTAAKYFNNATDVFYDVEANKPVIDVPHIISERGERLPYEFLKKYGPDKFELRELHSLSGRERKDYVERLRTALKDDIEAQRRMQNRISLAIDLAMKRVQWNYKSSIPMYYPRLQKVVLLLPLCLVNDTNVDVALVVSKEPSGRYQGQTIYPLDWAYKCARLVCRPDSDWLTADILSDTSDDE